jgi:hypothetical protein
MASELVGPSEEEIFAKAKEFAKENAHLAKAEEVLKEAEKALEEVQRKAPSKRGRGDVSL